MAATDICLQLLNLAVYLALNIYSIKVRQWEFIACRRLGCLLPLLLPA